MKNIKIALKNTGILFILFSIMFMPGCSSRKSPPPKVFMVTDIGGLGDSSFNDMSYRGLEIGKELGFDIKCVPTEIKGHYLEVLSALANEKPALIIALGALMSPDVLKAAEKYPDIKFVIIDGDIFNLPNILTIRFREEEGAYLAGVLSGFTTKSKIVGFLGGMDIPVIHKFEAGFRAGVMTASPDCKVKSEYTGSFNDPALGEEKTARLYEEGADIVFHASGKCGLGAVEASKKAAEGHYLIGVDSNQDKLAPGIVLTSVIKRTDIAVFDAMKLVRKKRFKGGILELGIKEDGLSLSPMEYTEMFVSALAQKKVYDLTNMIQDGKLEIPKTMEELKKFQPPLLEEKTERNE